MDKSQWNARIELVEEALIKELREESALDEQLCSSMKYSLTAGGKRLRPILLMAAADVAGGRGEDFIQVACAIYFLHSNGLAHRDIKPENILIGNDDRVKLCDFGWCVDISQGERATFCGTVEYMSPEIINDQSYDYSTDIWSLGVLLYEMTHGYSPFSVREKVPNVTKQIFENINARNYTINKNLSPELVDLIGKMLTIDMKSRIKIGQVFEHSWVKKNEKEFNNLQINQALSFSIS